MPTTTTQAVSPGYIYTVTASSEAIVRDVETDKLLCKANNGKQGMFIAIGGTASMVTDDPTATITQSSTTSSGARFEVHQTRPATGEEGVIYLIPITSSTEEENEYEEWIWVKGEWERLGTTGVNLSNYATLTGANTYSGDNTFNGLLIKKNSSSLGDTSVLNRYESDSRYGRLTANNTWQGVQYMQSPLTMHPNFAIITNHIQGHNDAPNLTFNGLHLTDIKAIDASSIKVTNAIADVLHVGTITSSNSSTIRILSPVNVGQEITVNGNLSIHPDRKLIVDTITTVSGQPLDINDGLTVAETIDTPRIGNYGGTLDIDSDVSLNTYNILANGISVNGVECANMNVDAIDSSSSLNVDINASTLTIKGTVDARSDIKIHANAALSTNEIASTSNDRIFINNELCLQGNNISNVNTLFTSTLRTRTLAPETESFSKMYFADVSELQFVNSAINNTTLSGVQILKNESVTVAYDDRSTLQGVHSMFVQAPEGIKVASAVSNTPDVTIAPSKIEAFQLNEDLFGENKYGLRITPESCQLFGIDFAYSDIWSSYPVDNEPPVFSPLDTVKIMKPSLSVASTDIAAVDFDYANKVLFRTFPNDGGIAIFEFQAGHWSDDSHSSITPGIIDLRKPSMSVENLQHNSLINKTELLELVPIKTDKSNNKLSIGYNAALGEYGSVYITPRSFNNEIVGENSVIIGNSANGGDYSVAIGASSNTVSGAAIAIGHDSTAETAGIGIGEAARASIAATALGYSTVASYTGVAIGPYCSAANGMLNISTGGEDGTYGARCSMLWYGGASYETRDNTGYLQFEIGNTFYRNRYDSGAQNDTITISKPNLWSALDRAKYRGAQPYKYYIASAIASIPALEPNSITHIGAYSSGAAIDLSGITLAQYDDTITTAELWIEVSSSGTTITWPEGMLWPDEADPTVAPSFSGPEASIEVGYITQRIYCVTLRTQRRRNLDDSTLSSVLIASIAYAVDSKLLTAGEGSD